MGFPAYWASQALALTQAGAMVGRVGWGIVSDRLFGGRRKIVLILIGLLSATSIMALGFLGANHRCICYYRFFFWRACAWSAIKEYPTRSLGSWQERRDRFRAGHDDHHQRSVCNTRHASIRIYSGSNGIISHRMDAPSRRPRCRSSRAGNFAHGAAGSGITRLGQIPLVVRSNRRSLFDLAGLVLSPSKERTAKTFSNPSSPQPSS